MHRICGDHVILLKQLLWHPCGTRHTDFEHFQSFLGHFWYYPSWLERVFQARMNLLATLRLRFSGHPCHRPPCFQLSAQAHSTDITLLTAERRLLSGKACCEKEGFLAKWTHETEEPRNWSFLAPRICHQFYLHYSDYGSRQESFSCPILLELHCLILLLL